MYDAQRPKPSGRLWVDKAVGPPKRAMRIGNWNVRTLYSSGNVAQAAREMSRRDIDIMRISETTGRVKGRCS